MEKDCKECDRNLNVYQTNKVTDWDQVGCCQSYGCKENKVHLSYICTNWDSVPDDMKMWTNTKKSCNMVWMGIWWKLSEDGKITIINNEKINILHPPSIVSNNSAEDIDPHILTSASTITDTGKYVDPFLTV